MNIVMDVVVVVVSVMIVLTAAVRLPSGDTLTISMPSALVDRLGSGGVVQALPALFGKFPTGRTLDAPIRVIPGTSYGCGNISAPVFNDDKHLPYIGITRRGGNCTFVEKARIAQDAGAAALIVVNNKTSEPSYMGVGPSDYALSRTVDIPVVMIRLVAGEAILAQAADADTSGMVHAQFRAGRPNPALNESVTVALYLRVDGPQAEFMNTFSSAIRSLGSSAQFSLHFILDRTRLDPNSCTNGNRYCAQSKESVAEALRQLCIVKSDGWERWASYYSSWMEQCHRLGDISDGCFARIYSDDDSVRECMAKAGGLNSNKPNTLLEEQLRDPRQLQYSPMLIVNNVVFESQLSCSSVHDCPPLSFLCMMFSDDSQPAACTTSLACSSFGESPDICGTCRSRNDSSIIITDPSDCPITSPRLGTKTTFSLAALLVVLANITLAMCLVVVAIDAHFHELMRREVEDIINEYTPLNDTFSDPEYITASESSKDADDATFIAA